ncbi:hypothetical protein, partial [Klebsiella oxytoca]|uniref:hypothetical protein n=1 Tax=Klebsiella oxytoca TaxID=571 RepID=UPI001158A674
MTFEDIDTDTGDFVSKVLTTTIKAGETTGTISVTLKDDEVYEGPEDYKLIVQDGKDAAGNVVAKPQAGKDSVTTTIHDDGTTDGTDPVDPTDPTVGDDRPNISISGPADVAEGAGQVDYTVTLDKVSAVDTIVTVTFEDIDTDTG